MARERKFSTDDLFQEAKKILLDHGYEGFTFSLLADRLEISRGAIYKYYENKEELITDYMVYEMEQFLLDLKKLEQKPGFESQFDYLLDIIFKHHKIHQILGIAKQIPLSNNEKVKINITNLERQHLDMYKCLQNFIGQGRGEKILKPHLADNLVLGFIFQSIMIPNHSGISHSKWVDSIKEILSKGIFEK